MPGNNSKNWTAADENADTNDLSVVVDPLDVTVQLFPLDDAAVDSEVTDIEDARLDVKEYLLEAYFSGNLFKVLEVLPGLRTEIDAAFGDLDSGFLGRIDPLSEDDFKSSYRAGIDLMEVTTEGNSYHNVDHSGDLISLAKEIIDGLEEDGLFFDLFDKQSIYLAIAYHDVDHCGRLGPDYSDSKNTDRTLKQANDSMKANNVPLEMRLKVLCIIKAMESFNNEVIPESINEVVAVMVDIGNFYKGFEDFMANNQKVMMEMYPPVVKDIASWKAQVDFFLGDYCVKKIKQFRSVADKLSNTALSKFLDKFDKKREEVLNVCGQFAFYYTPGKQGMYGMVDDLVDHAASFFPDPAQQ